MLNKLAHIFRPEEARLALDGGPLVHDYLDCYHRRGPDGGEFEVCSLEPAHQRMESSLHRGAGSDEVISSALLYAAPRLPACMPQVNQVILGPEQKRFAECGFGDISAWRQVHASKRRRISRFDGEYRLAVMVTSNSDLDDIIPGLCAYQIEWNKMHRRLSQGRLGPDLASGKVRAGDAVADLRGALGLNRDDFSALAGLWGERWDEKIQAIAAAPKDMSITILPLGEVDYLKMAEQWWERVLDLFAGLDLPGRPVYMVTSNNHSLTNLVNGFALTHEDKISSAIAQAGSRELRQDFRRMQSEPLVKQNLLYYAQDMLLDRQPGLKKSLREKEAGVGIHRSKPVPPLLAEAQVLELNRFNPDSLDRRLNIRHAGALAQSRAVILNTDYPLGFAAFHLLRTAGTFLKKWRGLFVLGKSAAMIGRLGDILIPIEVRDVHSQKLLSFPNCFNARRLVPYLYDSAVFDEQRSLTVHGTFLHSWESVQNLQQADFTGIEMEAGPCLAALLEKFGHSAPKHKKAWGLRPPKDFHLGILHYTSDTPYNLRASLLSKPLGLTGLESTYSCSLAILQYILDLESSGRQQHLK